jgi:hypothetical protein
MKLRFSIRDLLWLTALAAVLVAWWVDHRHLEKPYRKLNVNDRYELIITADGQEALREKGPHRIWIRSADSTIWGETKVQHLETTTIIGDGNPTTTTIGEQPD